jgi:mannose-1-phosphate guanylyltransferase
MFAVIMAGGAGTRFWPASRARVPKQFLKVTGERTMFEDTVARVAPLTGDERIICVVNRDHEGITRRLLGSRRAVVVAEPVGRNTAPCIGLAAMLALRQSADEPMIVLPADHFIADVNRFRRVLRAAAEHARKGGIVTLGIPPTRPETGYGYIEAGKKGETPDGLPYASVRQFIEKPDAETALSYVASGRFYWNSGIFVFMPGVILSEVQRHLPALYSRLCEIDRASNPVEWQAAVDHLYPQLESVSIDYGVMEKTDLPVTVFPGDFGWSDVGSWRALYELRQDEADGQLNLGIGDVIAEDAHRNLVYSQTDRVVALLGVSGLVVVDTPGALLVADMNRSQDVKKVAERLKQAERGDVL